MFKTIKSKIFTMGILIALIPMLIVLIYLECQKKSVKELAVAESYSQLNEQLHRISMSCSNQHNMLAQTITTNINVTKKLMSEKGGIKTLPETVEWKVKNQSTNEETTVNLSKLALGTIPIEKNYESNTSSVFVDDIKSLLGGTCTIFQRMNEQGDMVRVVTNIINKEGKRAIGTYIPAFEPNGVRNKVLESILKGESYSGRAQIIGEWYITSYLPIKSADDKVCGMLYFGIKQDNLDSIKKSITDIKVGKSGNIFVLGASGANKGHYLISNDTALESKSALEQKDTAGKSFISEILEKTISNKDKVNTFEYTVNTGNNNAVNMIYASVYFEPWDWAIIFNVRSDEFMAIADNITSVFDSLFNNFLLIAIIIVILSLLTAFYISRNVNFNISNLINECHELKGAILEGNLNFRGDYQKINIEFQDIIKGINNIMDAYDKPINEALSTMEKISENDLSVRMGGNYKGDFLKIKESINKAFDTLDRTLQNILASSEQLSASAVQISDGSQSLASGASEQASSLEEISSCLQEMNSMSKQNAANSKEGQNLILMTQKSSVQEVESMKELSKAINKIKESGNNTAKITKTIEEIAFQTNLLALNAAVEAAHAGDAGKGFAVVAEEVRNLAMRSAEAAKNTAQLIEEAAKDTEYVVNLNNEALKGLGEISSHINKVTDFMSEIAAASEQQSRGIDQINAGVSQLNQVTQQNAAFSEEAAGSAEELNSLSREMFSMILNFKLTGADRFNSKNYVNAVLKNEKTSGQNNNTKEKSHIMNINYNVKSSEKLSQSSIKKSPESMIPFDDNEILKQF